jgi:hypothetical protein
MGSLQSCLGPRVCADVSTSAVVRERAFRRRLDPTVPFRGARRSRRRCDPSRQRRGAAGAEGRPPSCCDGRSRAIPLQHSGARAQRIRRAPSAAANREAVGDPRAAGGDGDRSQALQRPGRERAMRRRSGPDAGPGAATGPAPDKGRRGCRRLPHGLIRPLAPGADRYYYRPVRTAPADRRHEECRRDRTSGPCGEPGPGLLPALRRVAPRTSWHSMATFERFEPDGVGNDRRSGAAWKLAGLEPGGRRFESGLRPCRPVPRCPETLSWSQFSSRSNAPKDIDEYERNVDSRSCGFESHRVLRHTWRNGRRARLPI